MAAGSAVPLPLLVLVLGAGCAAGSVPTQFPSTSTSTSAPAPTVPQAGHPDANTGTGAGASMVYDGYGSSAWTVVDEFNSMRLLESMSAAPGGGAISAAARHALRSESTGGPLSARATLPAVSGGVGRGAAGPAAAASRRRRRAAASTTTVAMATTTKNLATQVPTTPLPSSGPVTTRGQAGPYQIPGCKDVNRNGCNKAWRPCCPMGNGLVQGKAKGYCGAQNCDPGRDPKSERCHGSWMRGNCAETCGLCTQGACPFFGRDTGKNEVYKCADGSFCNGKKDALGLACCKRHGGRAMCPKNLPYMCGKPNACLLGTDFCCSATAAYCRAKFNGVRTCKGQRDPRVEDVVTARPATTVDALAERTACINKCVAFGQVAPPVCHHTLPISYRSKCFASCYKRPMADLVPCSIEDKCKVPYRQYFAALAKKDLTGTTNHMGPVSRAKTIEECADECLGVQRGACRSFVWLSERYHKNAETRCFVKPGAWQDQGYKLEDRLETVYFHRLQFNCKTAGAKTTALPTTTTAPEDAGSGDSDDLLETTTAAAVCEDRKTCRQKWRPCCKGGDGVVKGEKVGFCGAQNCGEKGVPCHGTYMQTNCPNVCGLCPGTSTKRASTYTPPESTTTTDDPTTNDEPQPQTTQPALDTTAVRTTAAATTTTARPTTAAAVTTCGDGFVGVVPSGTAPRRVCRRANRTFASELVVSSSLSKADGSAEFSSRFVKMPSGKYEASVMVATEVVGASVQAWLEGYTLKRASSGPIASSSFPATLIEGILRSSAVYHDDTPCTLYSMVCTQASLQAAFQLRDSTPPQPFNFTPMGGQFNFVWLSARTMHPHVGPQYVW